MKSSKNIFFITFIASQLSFSQALVISEIMYDPEGSDTGREWVEVYNDGSSDIDLTQYKLFENNVNHSISISQGAAILPAGGYAVIADNVTNFKNDFPSYTSPLFDSAFSLSNSGEALALKDLSQAIVFSSTYVATTTSSGTGGTLNFASSTNSYEVYLATPGVDTDKRTVSAPQGNTSNTSNQTAVNLFNSDPGRRTYALGEMYLLAPREIYGVAGGDVDFNLKVLDKNKAVIPTNTYWSFGDGVGKYSATATHRYVYPGVYNALVEIDVPMGFGIEKIKVNIIKPDISILRVETNPASITLKNNSDEEVDLQYAAIKSDEGVYPLSKHLIFSPRAEIKISGTSLNFNNLTNAKIIFINGDIISSLASSTSVVGSGTTTLPVIATATKPVIMKKVVIAKAKKSIVVVAKKPYPVATASPELLVATQTPATATVQKENTLKKIFYFLYE